MIAYVEGDATQPMTDRNGPRYIVHCCNDQGGWGSGFVVALSQRWAEPEREYRKWFAGADGGPYMLGLVQFVPVEQDIVVCNLIGQHKTIKSHPHPVKYDAIYEGLLKVADEVRANNGSLHMPRMGAGLAGGHWPVIEALVEETCGDLSVTVYDLPTTPPVRQEESFHDYAARWFPHHNGGLRP